ETFKGWAAAACQLDGYAREIRLSTGVLSQLDLTHRQFHELGRVAAPEIAAVSGPGKASFAHRTSELRAHEEVAPDANQTGRPDEAADAEMTTWQRIWGTNQLTFRERPAQCDAWEPLPAIASNRLLGAFRSFAASSAREPSRLVPRSLGQLSDEALVVLG
ncbi:unnamed protein product, partial [Prorocentrum cordatum]